MTELTTPIRPERLKKLLRRLVDIYSPSGKEEEVLHFLQGYLKRNALPFQCQPVDDNRYNLLLLPQGLDIRLALVGHLDTVVAYNLDDYGYTEDNGLISGLGVADMKGGCAAMVEAFIALWESGHTRLPVALCLVVGEEEKGDGAECLVEDYHFPWAIIGEPTDNHPCLSSYGYIEIQICTLGKRMHASMAKTGKNPIEAMLRLMLKVTQYIEEDHPEIFYNIRDIFSSQSGFAVPEKCEAWLDVHLPPSDPGGEITTGLEEIIAREHVNNADIDATLRIVTIDAGYELPEKGPVVKALKKIYSKRSLGWQPHAFRSHSDANQLWAAGVKGILLGPGSLEEAHAPRESASFEQVCLAAQLYYDLLTDMFCTSPS
jgi:acetylornithine deacetylase